MLVQLELYKLAYEGNEWCWWWSNIQYPSTYTCEYAISLCTLYTVTRIEIFFVGDLENEWRLPNKIDLLVSIVNKCEKPIIDEWNCLWRFQWMMKIFLVVIVIHEWIYRRKKWIILHNNESFIKISLIFYLTFIKS